MNELPNPLTQADCDLRDFQYMPLDVLRLRDSDLAARVSGEEFRCAVLLWCAAWHQTPAGSLPDDDVNLAQYAGFGRAVDQWERYKEGALRGWIKCSDGRLYHPVVAEKANESWFAKHRRSHDQLCERVRKRNKARGEAGLLPLEVPPLEQWIDMGRPLEKSLFPSEFSTPSGGKPKNSGGIGNSSGGNGNDFRRKGGEIPPENALKGTEGNRREGNGEVNLKTEGANGGSGTPRASDEKSPMPPAAISIALIGWERERNKAARGITASNQQVIDLAALHVTPEELRRAYEGAVADRHATDDPNPINAGFIRTFVEKYRRPAITRMPQANPRDERRRAGWAELTGNGAPEQPAVESAEVIDGHVKFLG
ncbi:MAG: DUF1376 domain-containing protein [Paraburkholderia fungorum]|nr:DUF1376 domain-containing protein [Paraburkholderia fungorum]